MTNNCDKINSYDYCEICLSKNRNLSELGDFSLIYQLLLNHNDIPSYNINTNKSICWECKALFKRILIFQKRIKMTHVIRLNKMIEQKPLSSLINTRIITENTHSFIYDGEIGKRDVQDTNIDEEEIVKTNEDDLDYNKDYFEDDAYDDLGPVIELNEEEKLKTRRKYTKSKQIFTCDYCKRNFKRKMFILNHIQLEHLDLSCNVCNKKFNRYKTLKLHKKLKHTEIKEDKQYCVECDKYFFNSYFYKKHIKNTRSHTPKIRKANVVSETQYCVQCKKHYKNIWSYKSHLYKVNHGSAESIKCPKCDKVFKHKAYLKDHYDRAHLHNFKYNCELCYKKFLKKAELNIHVRIVHDKISKKKNGVCVI